MLYGEISNKPLGAGRINNLPYFVSSHLTDLQSSLVADLYVWMITNLIQIEMVFWDTHFFS